MVEEAEWRGRCGGQRGRQGRQGQWGRGGRGQARLGRGVDRNFELMSREVNSFITFQL